MDRDDQFVLILFISASLTSVLVIMATVVTEKFGGIIGGLVR